MDFIELIKNGDRITLDFFTYAATFSIPASALALLVVIPNIPGVAKQILALPLLIANLLYPMLFTSHPSKYCISASYMYLVLLN